MTIFAISFRYEVSVPSGLPLPVWPHSVTFPYAGDKGKKDYP